MLAVAEVVKVDQLLKAEAVALVVLAVVVRGALPSPLHPLPMGKGKRADKNSE